VGGSSVALKNFGEILSFYPKDTIGGGKMSVLEKC
jgi:hypothetical protein